ncbi:ribosomal large subunit pseudouridine synthase D [bacterium BMS3Bbin06]|nr:ribosomal large subunit pseudouridine synthase D [bacterium BMS3Abin08]GBE33912.1 ribosomal large subunit pseudouridine synthase D [bacterium BMS3Bbin06]
MEDKVKMENMCFEVSGSDEVSRLDIYLSQKTGRSRSSIGKLISSGGVLVNGSITKPGYRLRNGDRIDLCFPQETDERGLIPEDLPLEIVYRDDDIIVIDKPPGMVMYPAAGHPQGTLMNALAHHVGSLAAVGAPLRPGVVHRLDRDTSGLVVVALSDRAYHDLVIQFKERTIDRYYLVLVYGPIGKDSGEIDLPIGRSRQDRKRMSTRSGGGRQARTAWEVVERFREATLLKARLLTGRTHQVRVHFSAIGHPVLGDRTYGRKDSLRIGNRTVKLPRQMLHAATLGIRHPIRGDRLEFSASLPADMKEVLELIRGGSL